MLLPFPVNFWVEFLFRETISMHAMKMSGESD
jgi:hypothetical protein